MTTAASSTDKSAGGTPWPILIALGFVLAALGALLAVRLLDDEATPDGATERARIFAQGMAAGDQKLMKPSACADWSDMGERVQSLGEIQKVEMRGDATVDGDTATAALRVTSTLIYTLPGAGPSSTPHTTSATPTFDTELLLRRDGDAWCVASLNSHMPAF